MRIDAIASPETVQAAAPMDRVQPRSVGGAAFGQMLSEGIEQVNQNLLEADRLTRAYALGEDMPIHQVTFALEHARLSFELMLQVRNRLMESYQEIMRMQV